MSGVRFHLEWLTVLDWVVIAALLLLLAALAALGMRGAARDRELHRQRQQAWARHYFRGGGLIRALMSRWQGPARLTDQRGEGEGGS
jgi:hypothetical protein